MESHFTFKQTIVLAPNSAFVNEELAGLDNLTARYPGFRYEYITRSLAESDTLVISYPYAFEAPLAHYDPAVIAIKRSVLASGCTKNMLCGHPSISWWTRADIPGFHPPQDFGSRRDDPGAPLTLFVKCTHAGIFNNTALVFAHPNEAPYDARLFVLSNDPVLSATPIQPPAYDAPFVEDDLFLLDDDKVPQAWFGSDDQYHALPAQA
jgi:hypothetical protein